jgi:sulfur-oxidizing protein SoxZ
VARGQASGRSGQGPGQTPAGDSIRVRTEAVAGGLEVKLLVRHPMQPRVVDERGRVIAEAHHITRLICRLDDQVVFIGDLGGGISKNPFFAFVVPSQAAQGAAVLSVEWEDNHGASDRITHRV